MADDIARWLEGLGLGQYAKAFADNGIRIDILPHLSDDDLDKLGLNLGDRRRLQLALGFLTSTDQKAEETTAQPLPEPATTSEAERRQLTVLFCDLVGSTALSSQLDPEDMREVIRAYQDTVAGVVTRYDGYIAKYMGDGVLAYFGFPQAFENDAERAVHVGLEVTEAVGKLSVPDGDALAARIGIATGSVVVGDIVGRGAAQETAIAGETPNLAARLQEIAEPGTVVVAEATHRLTDGLFESRTLGRRELKGFADIHGSGAWHVPGSSSDQHERRNRRPLYIEQRKFKSRVSAH